MDKAAWAHAALRELGASMSAQTQMSKKICLPKFFLFRMVVSLIMSVELLPVTISLPQLQRHLLAAHGVLVLSASSLTVTAPRSC